MTLTRQLLRGMYFASMTLVIGTNTIESSRWNRDWAARSWITLTALLWVALSIGFLKSEKDRCLGVAGLILQGILSQMLY